MNQTTAVEITVVWWSFWMAIEGFLMYRRWPTYVRIYHLAKLKGRCPLWLMATAFILFSPGYKIWEVLKPLFVLERYRVQIEIFRHDGRNAKVASDVLKVSDGERIAMDLIDGDFSISSIYYQVVTIHEEGVLDAKPETPKTPS